MTMVIYSILNILLFIIYILYIYIFNNINTRDILYHGAQAMRGRRCPRVKAKPATISKTCDFVILENGSELICQVSPSPFLLFLRFEILTEPQIYHRSTNGLQQIYNS